MTSPPTRLLGQFDVGQAPGVRRLATTIRRTSRTPTLPSQGKVTAVNGGSPPTCTVVFDDGDPALLRYLKSYTPTVNDIVEIRWRDGDPYILGTLA